MIARRSRAAPPFLAGAFLPIAMRRAGVPPLFVLAALLAGCPAPDGPADRDVGLDTASLDAPAPSPDAPTPSVDAPSGALDAPDVASRADGSPRDTPARDVPRDTGPAPTAEERAACANLEALAAMCGGMYDEWRCFSSRVTERDLADPDCYPEYDAWLACLTTWSMCTSGTGLPCPAEYGAFADCVRP